MTKLVTRIRKCVTCVRNSVTAVTNFLTNFFLADSKKIQGEEKKYLGASKKDLRDNARLVEAHHAHKRMHRFKAVELVELPDEVIINPFHNRES